MVIVMIDAERFAIKFLKDLRSESFLRRSDAQAALVQT
jgi:hypothetical protein